nr:hypothetical protein [Kibdelosporangium sp. MJ126-NF4]CEL17631.1 hypothetical protein [Kibdelosporangium sp. MJ126-NF4]CTQ91141.1 hypothetical protein [Kibdelosporangium sp. MJ126-NF4]
MTRAGSISVLVAVLAAAGCTTPAQPGLPTRQPTTDTSSTTANPKTAVEAAYDEYWKVEHMIMQLPESEWRAAMGKVSADPQLGRVVDGLRSLRSQSLTLYGSVTSRVSSVDIAGDRATLRDCQDASKAGQADAATGKAKTVGVLRSPVEATLDRGNDGSWRVTSLSYPGGTC